MVPLHAGSTPAATCGQSQLQPGQLMNLWMRSGATRRDVRQLQSVRRLSKRHVIADKAPLWDWCRIREVAMWIPARSCSRRRCAAMQCRQKSRCWGFEPMFCIMLPMIAQRYLGIVVPGDVARRHDTCGKSAARHHGLVAHRVPNVPVAPVERGAEVIARHRDYPAVGTSGGIETRAAFHVLHSREGGSRVSLGTGIALPHTVPARCIAVI